MISHRGPFSARDIIDGGLLRFFAVSGAAEKLDFGHWRSPVACPSCAKGMTCFRKSDLSCARDEFQVAYAFLGDRRTSGLARFGV
jgi:hypothetical protein